MTLKAGLLGLSHPNVSFVLLQHDITSGMHLAFTIIGKFRFKGKFKRWKTKMELYCLFWSMSFQCHPVIDMVLYSLYHIKSVWIVVLGKCVHCSEALKHYWSFFRLWEIFNRRSLFQKHCCVSDGEITKKVNETSTSHNPPLWLPDIIRLIEQSTVCALPFPSTISYFRICARMNQSLIPPFTGV